MFLILLLVADIPSTSMIIGKIAPRVRTIVKSKAQKHSTWNKIKSKKIEKYLIMYITYGIYYNNNQSCGLHDHQPPQLLTTSLLPSSFSLSSTPTNSQKKVFNRTTLSLFPKTKLYNKAGKLNIRLWNSFQWKFGQTANLQGQCSRKWKCVGHCLWPWRRVTVQPRQHLTASSDPSCGSSSSIQSPTKKTKI